MHINQITTTATMQWFGSSVLLLYQTTDTSMCHSINKGPCLRPKEYIPRLLRWWLNPFWINDSPATETRIVISFNHFCLWYLFQWDASRLRAESGCWSQLTVPRWHSFYSHITRRGWRRDIGKKRKSIQVKYLDKQKRTTKEEQPVFEGATKEKDCPQTGYYIVMGNIQS